ncbi:F-box/kelch-repeat protein At3g06240-like, partial [Lotus japonicus]|uniref:F-box/kelch-repeat protein At3g06240-like n=1 Tax=Lotus japonicus TaxID=34305 RepID=UPI0025856DF7
IVSFTNLFYQSNTSLKPSIFFSSIVLPDELIEAILVRLPVSSLLRFKCVSKLWFSVISDPQFAKSQFDLAASPNNRLLLNVTDDLKFQSLDIDSSPPNNESAVLNYPSEPFFHTSIFYRKRYLEFLGSCRGFVLILLPNLCADFLVCNPTTGVQRLIPQSASFSYSPASLYGIGYDESTDDYLLVSINSYGCDRTINLFSLKTNLPRSLTLDHEYHQYHDCGSRSGLLLHGSLHWLVTSSAKKHHGLLAFDLVGKCLSEIALPPDLALELKKKSYCLREMRGCLGLCDFGYGGITEIWIMKEYKVQSSWTKIVFSTHDIHTKPRFFPICFTKCGDIFGSTMNGRLLKLNDKGKLLAVWPRESKYHLFYSGMYTASLLSLPS